MTRACIDPSAQVGEGSRVGPGSVVGPEVRIGKDCRIGCNVVIHAGTVLGDAVRVDDNTVIGKLPMRSVRSAITKAVDLPPARLEDGCLVGVSVVVYRGARIGARVLLADFVSVREEVDIGEETIVGRGVAVENRVTIGPRCKIETNAYVTALSKIGRGCFIAPMATFTNDNFMGRSAERFKHFGGVTMRDGARVGANATVLPGITIGEDGMVAAGSVVTRDVPARKIVVGSPAKVWRDVPDDQLLDNQT